MAVVSPQPGGAASSALAMVASRQSDPKAKGPLAAHVPAAGALGRWGVFLRNAAQTCLALILSIADNSTMRWFTHGAQT